jgi:nucleotide-binding universal stress UspA family protein
MGTIVSAFESVLCAVDFTPPSSAALQAAAGVVSRSGGHLTALCVEDPLLGAGASAVGYNTTLLRKSTIAQLQRLMHRVVPELPPDAWSVASVLGRPAAAILAFARRNNADLIVLGTNGRRGPAKFFFGSVAEAVLRRAQSPVLPVLIVPRGRPRRARKTAPTVILGAIDLGPNDRSDARSMADVARRLGAPLTLLHVVPRVAGPPFLAPQLERHDRQRFEAARARLTGIAKSVKASARVVLGYPDEEIPAAALDAEAGLIVLALRRGRGIFGRRQGTTTYHVLCGSPVAVLALPPGYARS